MLRTSETPRKKVDNDYEENHVIWEESPAITKLEKYIQAKGKKSL